MGDFQFAVTLTVRIADLNYANHVGYQHYLSYFQEARLAYLGNLGYSELDIDGCAILVAEVNCRYKRQLFLKDVLQVECRVSALRSKGFRIEYRIRRDDVLCAEGSTECLCIDPARKTVVKLPERFCAAVNAFEKL